MLQPKVIPMNDPLLTTTDWYKMATVGLMPETSTELIEGTVIDRVPIGTTHSGCVNWLTKYLSVHLLDRAVVCVQNPLHLSEFSKPQPDLLILKLRADFYRQAHPQANEVLLLIEVAETSDTRIKMPLCARYGILEMWLVNLTEACVEIYREPDGEQYQYQQTAKKEVWLQPLFEPQIQIAVAEIMGIAP